MLLIAAFAIYVIIVKRVRITRSFTLTGTDARNFGVALLLLFLPVLAAINLLLAAVLPEVVRQIPFLPKLLVIVIFGIFAFGLAVYFKTEPASSSPHATGHDTSTEGPVV